MYLLEPASNRDDIIENLTDEQKEERLVKIREYKKDWAKKQRENKVINLI
jgi:hypothetical protein